MNLKERLAAAKSQPLPAGSVRLSDLAPMSKGDHIAQAFAARDQHEAARADPSDAANDPSHKIAV